MTAGELCTRSVRTVEPWASAREAAIRMRDRDVGCLVVIAGHGPIEGIVTDRDLAIRLVADRNDPDTTSVATVMTRGFVGIPEETPIERAIGVMADCQVRRLVVTDEDGGLLGILALDDVLELVMEEAGSVGRLLRGQVLVHGSATGAR